MTARVRMATAVAVALAFQGLLVGEALAGRGGGGGFRGGSVRQASRPSAARPRPATVSRPTPPRPAARPAPATTARASVARPTTLAPSAPRPASVRPATTSYAGNSYRPANMGSVTRPSANLVLGSIGAGTVAHAGAAGVSGTRTMANGVSIGAARGPGGGTIVAIKGPGGVTAVRGMTASGTAVAGIRGANGGTLVGARGAGGQAAWVATLPAGANQIHYGGSDYWTHDHNYYQPYWYADNWYYAPVAPPVGVYWDELPADFTPVTIESKTYYTDPEGTAYVAPVDGKYQVVSTPAGVEQTPDPLEILHQMTDYVAKQKDFTVTAREVSEEILDTGAKAQLESERVLHVRRPDKVAAEYHSTKGNRKFLFDKGQVTVLDLDKKAYANLRVQDSIDGMLDDLAEKHGVSVMIGDLLSANAYARLAATVTQAQYVGLTGNAVKCHHLAFTQDAVDWQIWIKEGTEPLPRKMLATYKTLPGSPTYEVTLSIWDESPNADSVFALQIPEGMKKIEVTRQVQKSAAPGTAPAAAPSASGSERAPH